MTVIANYGDEFNILLNKFPITPYHLLLTTKEFKSQTSPLSPNELVASFKILIALEKGSTKNEKYFGFYNCGENAGASQPHKHLQFLKYPDNFTPFPSVIAGGEEPYIATSSREPLQSKNLPFAHFVLPLPRNEDQLFEEDYLTMALVSLMQRALTILRDTENPVAYNVIFTRKWMMVVPRSDGYYKGKLGINSAGYTGLLLAKNEELKELIKEDGPLNVLREVGFANTADAPTDEYHY
jgi:ATP adenylyltransferase